MFHNCMHMGPFHEGYFHNKEKIVTFWELSHSERLRKYMHVFDKRHHIQVIFIEWQKQNIGSHLLNIA